MGVTSWEGVSTFFPFIHGSFMRETGGFVTFRRVEYRTLGGFLREPKMRPLSEGLENANGAVGELGTATAVRERAVGLYAMRFAETREEKEAALRLRFQVFNLEMNEGLDAAYWHGVDRDEFDEVCDHLIVEHGLSGEIIGTYRLQTGQTAVRNLGYYSEREFDFSPYELMRDELVELGRAAIRKDH